MELKTIELDYCWCCGERFTCSTPPGPALIHRHHMIPVAYGGRDGPTITICDTNHNTLHQVAVALKNDKPYFQLLQGASNEEKQRILYLAMLVYNAELQTRNDPNKLASAMVSLGYKHKLMIDRLKKVYPQAKSREKVLLLALEQTYKKHFG